MRVYLVAMEGALIWNGEQTPWTEVEASSAEEAAARHVAQVHDHFRRDRHIAGVNVLHPEIYPTDEIDWPPPTDSTGPYVVKLQGQADSEAIAVLVDIRHFLTARQVPRHVCPDPYGIGPGYP